CARGPPRHRLARPARGRQLRAARGAAGRPEAHDVCRIPPRHPMIAPSRRVAHHVVRRVFEGDAYTDRAFPAAATELDARDRALAQRIAYGTVQRVRTIDHGIDTLGKRPTRKLDPAVLAALRVAGYELGWSEAPAHAVADDAVELVRAAGLE